MGKSRFDSGLPRGAMVDFSRKSGFYRLMDNVTRNAIFAAQVQNVRCLESALKQIRRAVNDGLRQQDDVQVSVHTRVLAQTFCSWAEANFSKVIHTPHGFTLVEIADVKRTWKAQSLAHAWREAVNLGLAKVPEQPGNFIGEARRQVNGFIDQYVSRPALIRNKIAHGQWQVALNRNNTATNDQLTEEMSLLSVIDVDRWLGGHRRLAGIVESLIESPERTFALHYWPQLRDLEDFAARSAAWTIEAKRAALRRKRRIAN